MKKLLNKGFTIVELVIVIAVIGILAAVLIPTFSNVIQSAKETAEMQEAKSTLDSYVAFMASQGNTLNDGTVFKIKESGTTFVYYKGELKKFVAEDVNAALPTTPAIKIGNASHGCDKFYLGFDTNNNGLTDDAEILRDEVKNGENVINAYITFFYNSEEQVTFEDGSLKCQIYAGTVVTLQNKMTTSTVDWTGDSLAAKIITTFVTNPNIAPVAPVDPAA